MPRPSSAPALLVETLEPHVTKALQALPDGRQPGERRHRATRVRVVCDLLAARDVIPTMPLVRAFVTTGSPNDISADIRQWQRDAGKREPLINLGGEELKQIAGALESVALDVIALAKKAAQQELEPERERLRIAQQALDDRVRANDRLIEDARREANEVRRFATALEAQLAVESALRAAAEQTWTDASTQRDALATRLAHAEERLKQLQVLTKDNARLDALLLKHTTEIERLRAHIDALGEFRVKHEVAQRDLQHARTRLRDSEKQCAGLARHLERARQQVANAKAKAHKPSTKRSNTPTRLHRRKRQGENLR